MTLDEYKASLESKRVKTEFNIRKPNDGCVDEKWRKMYVLKSKEDDKNEEEEEEEQEYTPAIFVSGNRRGSPQQAQDIVPIEI
ncbi:hypothetical protein HELRODRAFT_195159, partial [Helobdella robusta]|uniref:Hyaluronan/mRNA-binding protein domain-containing protein n=1 Tax=Helobdella robusta TaxID=6412 RepID=T1FWT8_HELRO